MHNEKYYSGFIILKPECFLYAKYVVNIFNKNGYNTEEKFLIKNYVKFTNEMYYISNIKDEKFYEIIKICGEITKKMFGNNAILIKIYKSQKSYKDFLEEIDILKKIIRKKIALYKNKTLHTFINICNLNIDQTIGIPGSLYVLDKQNKKDLPYK